MIRLTPEQRRRLLEAPTGAVRVAFEHPLAMDAAAAVIDEL